MIKENLVTKISGVPEGLDADLLVEEFLKGSSLIHISSNDQRLLELKMALKFFKPDLEVLEFPAWDCLPYDRISPSSDVTSKRISTLSELANSSRRQRLVLTTVNAVTQRVPTADIIKEAVFSILSDSLLNIEKLSVFLNNMGFSKCSTVIHVGDYSFRGGIIDIFPPGYEFPVRLDLFGDHVEAIRRFDPNTQLGKENLHTVILSSASEVILDENTISNFRQNYRSEFGVPKSSDGIYEAVSSGVKYQGIEHWLPFYYNNLSTIFDYLPEARVFFEESFETLVRDRWSSITAQYKNRKDALARKGDLGLTYMPVNAASLYLDPDDVISCLKGKAQFQFVTVPIPTGYKVTDAGGRIGRNFAPERIAGNKNIFKILASYISTMSEKMPVILACSSEGSRSRLVDLLSDEGHLNIRLVSNYSEIVAGVSAVVWELPSGYLTSDYLVISEQDVLGERLVKSAKRKRRANNFLTELTSLSLNDLVVHLDHGIGRFAGLKTISAIGAPHECIELEYLGGDRLFLPVENIELLSKYGQENGALDKLGGSSWQAKKANLKKRIKDMAERLIKVAADRETKTAPKIEHMSEMWSDFCARFPYNETEDQMSTVDSIVSDLGRGIPMDRLICGDVGFGKTEIAMRAAFLLANAGYQVALVVPTTLLSRQHMLSFGDRFNGFPINIRQLSRFVTPADAAETRKGIENGTVDIVIGTHALISDKVKFNNLGLLIIDEEQHFGVQHKEKLKQLKSTIHVLTLSATPIPRTLQLSLSGVRELSIIETPPINRLAIRTYVTEFDPVIVREALLRETYRGGQSFFVVPRVADIPEIEEFLSNEVPEVTFDVAHGQLSAAELDTRMNTFYDGKVNVLVSTSIVESGIDVPTANTIIIYRSDMFGLSQLYQIRGRVGRAKVRAYAYLTTKPGKRLTRVAQKRLRVLGNIDTLGAGFNIASQDMDIRGAGNILGEEQSGNVREVGYELYQSMLEEAVAKIKIGDNIEVLNETDWSPSISLGVPVLIPETYVSDLDVRLGLYKRLSDLETKVELEGFAAELIDRFGKIPREVSTLFLVVRIKAMCKKASIFKFNGGTRGATIEFKNHKFDSPMGLAEFISEQRGLAQLRDNKLIVKRDWKSNADKIKGAFSIARDLASKVMVK
ncbi:MAG: transcription-repair coupling factor [Paracoccaceae bacterium]